MEVILDLGRKPHARFQRRAEILCDRDITREDLLSAVERLGDFGHDNRAGIEGTLHRISAMRNRKGSIVGLTCRVGRAVNGHVDMIRDLLEGESFVGLPGTLSNRKDIKNVLSVLYHNPWQLNFLLTREALGTTLLLHPQL
jgi:stage III sporulation protein SpoIIIAA